MTARTSDQANAADRPSVLRALPGGMEASSDEMAVALTIAGAAATLYGLNRGLRGVGQLQLTGSAIRGLEIAAYLLLIGGVLRTIQTQYPDSRFSRAVGFLY